MSGGNIKVVVRCRPLNSREIARGAKGLIRMEGVNTYLDPPEAANVTSGRAIEKETKSFAFDKSYWSACGKDEPGYASQDTLYNDLGKDLLDHSFSGYNTCIFAYGQTGSGKSYSMMGYGDKGLIPLICEALFERKIALSTETLSFNVEVSYTEIYQEKVRDLLNPGNKGNLKVREHPTLGPYVEGLSKLAVENYKDVEALMDEGTKARTVAATNMNETSSRSHAVFTLLLTQRRLDPTTAMVGEKVSRISLVDLAGSERANATGATGTRLKEGALINKSLTTLGRVIAALAAASAETTGKGAKAAAEKVPYRDSVLTWLLKDSLGGNSKTAMVAAISPADYDETLSTLRYADQAKKIKNKAVINEDPNAKLIRELKEELAVLRVRMTGASSEAIYDASIPPEQQIVQYKTKDGEIKTISKADLQDQLEASERLMASVSETWEDKLARTQEIQKEREDALEALGITIEKNLVGVHTPKKMPHLVNLNEDPLMSECLIYQIKPGRTMVGNSESEKHADIRLSGSSILPEHCYFESTPDGKVVLHAMPESTTMVNGMRIPSVQPRELRSGFRIILGDFHVFRFNHPEEVRRARFAGGAGSEMRSPLHQNLDDGYSSPANRPDSPMSMLEDADWSYARKEAVVARLNGANVNLDKLRDDDLNKLFADIVKVRHARTTSMASIDRPESRMSYLGSVTEDGDEDDSQGSPTRPFSGSTWSTVATSLAESSAALSTPPDDDRFQAVKDEYEQRFRTMSESAAEVDDAKEEKRIMEDKLKSMEAEMQSQKEKFESRVKQLRKGAPAGEDDIDDSMPLSPRQEMIARESIRRWRCKKRVRMAEDALSQAVVLKEANVISRELKKGVTFQFVVVHAEVPGSASQSSPGLTDIEDISDPSLASSSKPCIGVKVLDRKHQAIYIWSLAKLRHRLQQMRNLYKFIGTEYSQHFSWEDPFYESPSLPGNFSFVGTALVALAPLSRNLPSTSTLQLFSPYTADPIGSCQVSLTPISLITPATPTAIVSNLDHSPPASFVEGSIFEFEIAVEKVMGLSDSEFRSVHLQFDLASFFGPTLLSDDTFTSPLVDIDTRDLSQVQLKRSITVGLTPEIYKHLSESYAPIHLFARIKGTHLDKIERWDEARDSATTSKKVDAPSLRGDPVSSDVTRRPENELVSEQTHDVLASVEIRELGESGEYVPVQVASLNGLDSGAFFLRQGLQRRFALKITHNSGKGWKWRKISKLTMGNVRMLDGRGSLHTAANSVTFELRPTGTTPRATYSQDGTASLSFSSSWDSSVHDSPFLNKNTAQGHRALICLSWEVEADNCSSPISFSMDIAVTVQSRDARAPSKIMSFITSSQLSSRITSLFAIRLTPFMTKKPTDIWRLNTAETFVRGEEVLLEWKPRGLSLIRDHDEFVKVSRRLADIEAAKAILKAFEGSLPSPVRGLTRQDRLSRVIELWRKRFGTREEISLEKEAVAIEAGGQEEMRDLTLPPTSLSSPSPVEKKLEGSATLVSKSETAARRGPLAMLRDPTSSQWKKYWVVLRRPYLHLYESSASEREEVGVINISTVRVEQSPEIEEMLDRRFSFAIFTHQNSYFLQAPSERDRMSWISLIDPSIAAQR